MTGSLDAHMALADRYFSGRGVPKSCSWGLYHAKTVADYAIQVVPHFFPRGAGRGLRCVGNPRAHEGLRLKKLSITGSLVCFLSTPTIHDSLAAVGAPSPGVLLVFCEVFLWFRMGMILTAFNSLPNRLSFPQSTEETNNFVAPLPTVRFRDRWLDPNYVDVHQLENGEAQVGCGAGDAAYLAYLHTQWLLIPC